jgi:hypothetical protein
MTGAGTVWAGLVSDWWRGVPHLGSANPPDVEACATIALPVAVLVV